MLGRRGDADAATLIATRREVRSVEVGAHRSDQLAAEAPGRRRRRRARGPAAHRDRTRTFSARSCARSSSSDNAEGAVEHARADRSQGCADQSAHRSDQQLQQRSRRRRTTRRTFEISMRKADNDRIEGRDHRRRRAHRRQPRTISGCSPSPRITNESSQLRATAISRLVRSNMRDRRPRASSTTRRTRTTSVSRSSTCSAIARRPRRRTS